MAAEARGPEHYLALLPPRVETRPRDRQLIAGRPGRLRRTIVQLVAVAVVGCTTRSPAVGSAPCIAGWTPGPVDRTTKSAHAPPACPRRRLRTIQVAEP